YRVTGQWADLINMFANAMDSFESQWANSLLQTREMPSKAEIKQHIGSFIEPSPGNPQSGSGFTKWPLGVLDPITGIERVNLNWWEADQEEHYWDLWTEEQRVQFVNWRAAEKQELKNPCGLANFKLRTGSVRALLVPPSYSPSMEPHADLLHFQYGGTFGRAQTIQ